MKFLKQSICSFVVICVCFLCFLDDAKADQATYAFTNKLNMRFVSIPPGTFIMGSPPDEIGREHDEVQHSVTISKGFYISETEVTQAQWKKLMGNNPSGFSQLGLDRPVEQVSWHDSMRFIDKLNIMERTDKYRLPTEAEWEYACRAGSKSAFAGGDITEASCNVMPALADMAWYCANANSTTHPVRAKKPNAWGLYGMHGDVHEWCMDSCTRGNMWTRRTGVISGTYKEGVIDPVSTKGDLRVFRGGCWNQSSRYARSADRNCFRPIVRRTYIGFRVIKTK